MNELQFQTSLRKSIELAFETHKVLIKSKEDIIENMMLISSLSNVTEPVKEDNDLKKGVSECIEFLKYHANNDVILNGLLLWIDIQRKTTVEDIWKSQALNKFTREEITAAKEELWKIVGDALSGKLVKRQGASNSKVEIDDIAELFKKLSESSRLPMFIGTSNMIIKTPVYNVESDICDNSIIATRLKVLEESVSSLIKETKKRSETVTPLNTHHADDSSNSSEMVNSTNNNNNNNRFPIHDTVSNKIAMNNAASYMPSTNNEVNNGVPMYNGVNNGSLMNNVSSTPTNMTYADIVRNTTLGKFGMGSSIDVKGPTQKEGWRLVQPKKKETGTMRWRQRFNILSGTASDESGSNSFSADIHLVAYGVAKQVTEIQHFLQERGLNVLSCDLLTKYENARSLAYKISIRSRDYEKAQDPNIRPLRVGVRLFKYFKKRNVNTGGIEREQKREITDPRKVRMVRFKDQVVYSDFILKDG